MVVPQRTRSQPLEHWKEASRLLAAKLVLAAPITVPVPSARADCQCGASIRWSSGSVFAAALRARPITSRWISLVPSKMV